LCRSATIVPVATTVLIVDDHHGFRARARALLESEGYAVVGEAVNGASALASAQVLRPDVVLLDVMLPDATGFQVAERLGRLERTPRVILVSTREASDFGNLLTSSPALGFIPKPELSGSRLRQLLGVIP
jgi:DNA-binding NarL/FixJ family response regulator